jgi:nitroimidazol reductase NimA-like FMN-containing flavoprotein (pyridoxamine 5'-phosphate oxidase superfamily)
VIEPDALVVPYDSSGLQVLDRAECLRLLGTVPMGRVAFTVDALPAIQPVTFALVDDQIVIRMRHGSRLVAGIQDTIVAFEADHYDEATHSGWSVTVVGPAVTAGPELAERLARLPLRNWAPAGMEQYVLISIKVVHGRQITRTDVDGTGGRPSTGRLTGADRP